MLDQSDAPKFLRLSLEESSLLKIIAIIYFRSGRRSLDVLAEEKRPRMRQSLSNVRQLGPGFQDPRRSMMILAEEDSF